MLEPPGIGRVKNPLTQDALGLLFNPDNGIGWRGAGKASSWVRDVSKGWGCGDARVQSLYE
jgi:hypothetical protein